MDSCPLCEDACHHWRLREEVSESANEELNHARSECRRLAWLFKQICWYNFETVCKQWNRPWYPSLQQSRVELHGCRTEYVTRNGRTREIGHFPIYYHGPLSDAPPLPPVILLSELKDAYDSMIQLEAVRCNAFAWAPGGAKYQQLLKDTMVGKSHSSELLIANVHRTHDRGTKGDAYGGGYARQLGTRQKRASG